MPIEIIDAANVQDSDGQPFTPQTPRAEATTNDAAAADTATQNSEANLSGAAEGSTTEGSVVQSDAANPANGDAPTKADVNIPPEALRQITALSRNVRFLKEKLTKAEQAAKTPTPPADIATKLARLAQLENALKSPRAWMQLAQVDLEAVSKDVLASENEVVDPRVTTLAEQNAELRKEIDGIKTERQTEVQQQTAQQANARVEATIAHIKNVVTSTKLEGKEELRWDRVAKDENSARNAYEAALRVVDRDYSEQKDKDGNITRPAKNIDKNEAEAILYACLDEAEAQALAREILDGRKNGAGQAKPARARYSGIVFRESQAPDETSAPPPKPTIGSERGPMRTVQTPRGQVGVREARKRALRIAGAEDKE